MNLIEPFRDLFGPPPQRVVTVQSVGSNGTSVVLTPEGDTFTATGDSVAAGNKALIEGRRIVAAASNGLPTYNVNV